ncbi:TPR repeat domain protein [Candidatus Rhodobacter oscarellae]|uniref:TPR repeat domain protein n=1 Tax=Candidatus Rhodobacter oscarellae TaxID=1675527 RepID=A0A0J9E4H7_9RHOB|nr:sulfotransferase [Candidatus Rhodobacter lobularis]KMW57651.1 TPR repeat domain protein [Candidatus Rhodobacter lobularis]
MDEFGRNLESARKQAASGDLAGALTSIEAALRAARDAQVFRVRLLQALGRPREALDDILILDGPNSTARFLEMRANLEETLGLFAEAIATLGRAIFVAKQPGVYLGRRAVLHQTLGHFDEALQDIDRALTLRPLDGELYRMRSGLTHVGRGDEIFEKMENVRRLLKSGSLSMAHLDFARASALDDIGEFGAAGEALHAANRAMRLNQPYDIQTRLKLTQAVRTHFAEVTPSRIMAETGSEFAPIFVTGLARSGTTLVEQILAAHPDMSAGGESAAFGDAVAAVIGDPGAPRPTD